jgi:hypothetical protein
MRAIFQKLISLIRQSARQFAMCGRWRSRLLAMSPKIAGLAQHPARLFVPRTTIHPRTSTSPAKKIGTAMPAGQLHRAKMKNATKFSLGLATTIVGGNSTRATMSRGMPPSGFGPQLIRSLRIQSPAGAHSERAKPALCTQSAPQLRPLQRENFGCTPNHRPANCHARNKCRAPGNSLHGDVFKK